MIEFLAVAILGVLASCVSYGAYRADKRLSALKNAWPHRKRLAHLAGQIENDSRAPEEAREFVSFMADHAFDEKMQRELVRLSLGRRKDRGRHARGNRQYFERRFGSEYAGDVLDCAKSFAHILYENNKDLINKENIYSKADKKHAERVQITSIFDIFKKNENNGSPNGHATA